MEWKNHDHISLTEVTELLNIGHNFHQALLGDNNSSGGSGDNDSEGEKPVLSTEWNSQLSQQWH
jgi:hypothetical protein